MLDPDSDAARELLEHVSKLRAMAADAEIRAVNNRVAINRLKLALADIADPTLTADECRELARAALGWDTRVKNTATDQV